MRLFRYCLVVATFWFIGAGYAYAQIDSVRVVVRCNNEILKFEISSYIKDEIGKSDRFKVVDGTKFRYQITILSVTLGKDDQQIEGIVLSSLVTRIQEGELVTITHYAIDRIPMGEIESMTRTMSTNLITSMKNYSEDSSQP